MLIGELGKAAGLSCQTIRFYERERLLPEPSRAANGYRVYDESIIARLRFIRVAQAAGLTLAETRSILDLRDDGHAPCTHVVNLIGARLADVRKRIEELAAVEAELTHLLDRSRRLDQADCGDAGVCHVLGGGHRAVSEEATRPRNVGAHVISRGALRLPSAPTRSP